MASNTGMKREKRPPKTIKEKKFVKEYIKTGNATEAAMRTYDVKDRKNANALGTETLAKLSISDLMDNKGLTDDKLLDKLDEGLLSNRVISANIVVTKSDDPTVKDQKAHTKTQDFIEVPDMPTRHRYLETALKLKGYNTGDSVVVNVQNNVIQYPTKRPLVPQNNTD